MYPLLIETPGLNFASFFLYICIKLQYLTRDFFIFALIYEWNGEIPGRLLRLWVCQSSWPHPQAWDSALTSRIEQLPAQIQIICTEIFWPYQNWHISYMDPNFCPFPELPSEQVINFIGCNCLLRYFALVSFRIRSALHCTKLLTDFSQYF